MRTLSTLFAQDNNISGSGIQVPEETYWGVDQELPSEFQLYYGCKGVTCLVIELKCACNTHGVSQIVVNRLSWGVSGPNRLQSCPSWEIQDCYGGYQLIELGTLLSPNPTFLAPVFLFLFSFLLLFPCLPLSLFRSLSFLFFFLVLPLSLSFLGPCIHTSFLFFFLVFLFLFLFLFPLS